jgi:hypothetical protein
MPPKDDAMMQQDDVITMMMTGGLRDPTPPAPQRGRARRRRC